VILKEYHDLDLVSNDCHTFLREGHTHVVAKGLSIRTIGNNLTSSILSQALYDQGGLDFLPQVLQVSYGAPP
jgi:hypothetical protein